MQVRWNDVLMVSRLERHDVLMYDKYLLHRLPGDHDNTLTCEDKCLDEDTLSVF